MSRIAARADFFDASALVRVYCDEPRAIVVREYFRTRATKYTTPYCFYEAMNALKGKWAHKKQLTHPQYLDAAFHLAAWFGASSSQVRDLDFSDPLTFNSARKTAEKYAIDLSDAFQIVSVKFGYFSVLVNDSSTVLVTADSGLASAARDEGLRVWDVMQEDPPQ